MAYVIYELQKYLFYGDIFLCLMFFTSPKEVLFPWQFHCLFVSIIFENTTAWIVLKKKWKIGLGLT